MSETRSASQKQANSKESGLQITRTSRVRTAKIRRTREVIERVEVEHAAEAGELPVVTTAEQRVVKATEMERGKLLSDEPLPQEQVTSSSHTARKQPGRASKRSSENETDIPIEGDVGPSVHVSEVAQDEAGQMGPAFMSTQDYLEEAEDLLNHPLEPNPLDTQPEDGAQQEEADAGNPTGQAPEEAAAAGERLAEHIQGTGSAAHANEGGLVGRVAQVGRQIVRSLLHPNEHGHEEAPAAAAGAEDAGDQGERLDQEQAVGVVAAIAELAETAVEAGEKGSTQADTHRPGLEYRTLAEVAAEVAAEAAQAGRCLTDSQAADEMSGPQTAASPTSAGPAAAQIHAEQPEIAQEDATNQAEEPALPTEAVQVEESGYESDTGDQDEAPVAASADIADIAETGVQQIAVISSSTAVALSEAAAPCQMAARDESEGSGGFAKKGQTSVVADVAATAVELAPEEDAGHGPTQGGAAAGADTVMAEVEGIRDDADGAAANLQPAAMPPAARESAPTEAAANAPAVEAVAMVMFTDGAAADEPPAAQPVAAAEAAQAEEARREALSEQIHMIAPDAPADPHAEGDPAEAEAPTEAPEDAAQSSEDIPEPLSVSPHSTYTSSDPEQALAAAAAAAVAAVQSCNGTSADIGQVDGEAGLGLGEKTLAAAAAAAAEELAEGDAAEMSHDQARGAGAMAEEAGGEPATGATQEYHVEEPDQSASEAEEPQEQPSKGRGRSKKAETTPAQAAEISAEASAGRADTAGAKRGRSGAKKLKPYTPAKMAAMKNTPKEVQPVEEVLAMDEEAEPEEEAAPAPATPPAKRGRPAAPKTPPNTKGKGKAAAVQVQEEAGAPEAEESPVGKKARGHPSKAASASQPSKRSNPAKRSRVETAELQEEGDRSKKAQKTEANPAGSPESQAAPKTPARAARKPASAEPSPKTPSKAPAKASGAKTSPKKTASRAPAKTAGARAKGPQKKPARQAASRRKERTESFKIYIHRVLKEIHPDISLSQRAISVLDSFTKDMHDRIANEAGDLCRRHNKSTLSSREIDAAIRFLLPGELFNHAVAEGRKAVTRALTKSD